MKKIVLSLALALSASGALAEDCSKAKESVAGVEAKSVVSVGSSLKFCGWPDGAAGFAAATAAVILMVELLDDDSEQFVSPLPEPEPDTSTTTATS